MSDKSGIAQMYFNHASYNLCVHNDRIMINLIPNSKGYWVGALSANSLHTHFGSIGQGTKLPEFSQIWSKLHNDATCSNESQIWNIVTTHHGTKQLCIQVYMRPLEHRRIRYTPTTSIGFTMDTMIKPESCKKNDKTGVPGAKNTRTDKFSLHRYATHSKSLFSNIM